MVTGSIEKSTEATTLALTLRYFVQGAKSEIR